MRSRVLTAFGIMPFVLGAFFCASIWPILSLACLAAAISTHEARAMLKRREVFVGLFLVALFAVYGSSNGFFSNRSGSLIVVLLMFGAGVFSAWRCSKGSPTLATGIASAFWFCVPLCCLVALHQLPPHAGVWRFANPVLLAVLPLWGGDTAAIFVGKAYGKHPLAPKISPKKTVEGAAANVAACIGVAVPLGMWTGYDWPISVACGLCAGISGQLGDLFESYVKRQAGLKDSGSLLPGHGGLLDRIDSLLFTAPLVFALLLTVGPPHAR